MDGYRLSLPWQPGATTMEKHALAPIAAPLDSERSDADDPRAEPPPVEVPPAPAGELEHLRAELEGRLASTRGEAAARIAELEGELEALSEEREEWNRELDELSADLRAHAEAATQSRALAEQLHQTLSAMERERIELRAQLVRLEQDRERIQDDLAARISEIAAELAGRDREIQRLRQLLEERQGGGGREAKELLALRVEVEELRAKQEAASAGSAEPPAAEESSGTIARLQAELEDLQGENEFLNSELDRYAAEAVARRRLDTT